MRPYKPRKPYPNCFRAGLIDSRAESGAEKSDFHQSPWLFRNMCYLSIRYLAKYKNNMNTFIETTKAISDPNRVRILMALRADELCVCRIIELLQLAPSTVSKHLTILKQAGLIEGRKEGRWMYYRLPHDPASRAWNTLHWVFQSLKTSPDIKTDEARLTKIMKIDIEELCAIYKK
jgi:DNA-binding transcriptional ArsR family regulator